MTAEYLTVLDRNETPLGVLSTAENAQLRERLNGESLLSFTIPFDDEKYPLLELDGYVKCDGQLYVIKTIDDSSDASRTSATVQTVHVYVEAVDEYIDLTLDLIGTTALNALTQALSGTPFIVGTVTATGNRDIDLSEMSVLKAVQAIREKWDVDLWFDNRTVHLGAKGANNGVNIRYGKNMKSLRRPSSTTNVITRLYPYGRDGLTIEAVNGGLKYIDSLNIALYRNPKRAEVRFNDITTAAELKTEAQKYLAKHDTTEISYQIDFIELSKLGYSGEDIALGDTVTISHTPYNLQTVGTRVVEYVRFPFEQRSGSITLSSFIETAIDDVVFIKRRQITFERYANNRYIEVAVDATEKANTAETNAKDASVPKAIEFDNSVTIGDGNGITVADGSSNVRVRLGQYAAGKYGLLLKNKTGTATIIDEDGLMQTDTIQEADNVDGSHPLKLKFYVDDGVISVNKVNLNFSLEAFRAYSIGSGTAGNYGGGFSITGGVIGEVFTDTGITQQSGLGGGHDHTASSGSAGSHDHGGAAGSHNHGNVDNASYAPPISSDGSHSHSVSVSSVDNHTHLIELQNHSHTINIDHTHDVIYGIYEGTTASGVKVKVDGVERLNNGGAGYSTDQNSLDLTTWITTAGWHTVELTSSQLGRINASLYIKSFVGV